MASPVDTSVKFITENMPGAPVLSGTAGALISVLDALLVTGFGLRTATSVTVAGGVATVTLSSDALNGNLLHSVILVDGVAAPMADLNGEQRVTAATSTTLQFATAVADGTATGTITIKSAPVGWEKKYSDTNLAVYKSTDVQAHGRHWRVDDTGTTAARVVEYETMADVNTGSGPSPTAAYISGGGYVHKSAVASAAAARYAMAADSRTVLLALGPGTATAATYRVANIRGFGDAIALAPAGDSWASFVSLCGASATSGFTYGSLSGGPVSSVTGFSALSRSYTGLGASVIADAVPMSGTLTTMSGGDSFMGPAPSAVDGQIKLSRVFFREQGSSNPPRAIVPGVLYVPQSGLASLVAGGDIAVGAGDWAGRQLMAVACGTASNQLPTGAAFIDITGPWR
ncbi:MAG: hypothetical protein L6Q63_04230 [Giesbergeria sp.]|nr:hypothetical protein [Giesbergeria sp.]